MRVVPVVGGRHPHRGRPDLSFRHLLRPRCPTSPPFAFFLFRSFSFVLFLNCRTTPALPRWREDEGVPGLTRARVLCCVASCRVALRCVALCVIPTGEEEEEFPLVSKKQFDLFLRRFGPPERSLAKATPLLLSRFSPSLLCATSLSSPATTGRLTVLCVVWCCRFVMCSRTERSAFLQRAGVTCVCVAWRWHLTMMGDG